jgi:hypothetical protein
MTKTIAQTMETQFHHAHVASKTAKPAEGVGIALVVEAQAPCLVREGIPRLVQLRSGGLAWGTANADAMVRIRVLVMEITVPSLGVHSHALRTSINLPARVMLVKSWSILMKIQNAARMGKATGLAAKQVIATRRDYVIDRCRNVDFLIMSMIVTLIVAVM